MQPLITLPPRRRSENQPPRREEPSRPQRLEVTGSQPAIVAHQFIPIAPRDDLRRGVPYSALND